MAQHIRADDAHGIAALDICESLLLTLIDCKIINEKHASDLLTDVVIAHTKAAASSSPMPDKHKAVVEIVQRMLVGKNWSWR